MLWVRNPISVRQRSLLGLRPASLTSFRVRDQRTPAKGEVVVFNRSHYEDVLVVRVHKLVPRSVWSKLLRPDQRLRKNNRLLRPQPHSQSPRVLRLLS
jgi:hypothetical protein